MLGMPGFVLEGSLIVGFCRACTGKSPPSWAPLCSSGPFIWCKEAGVDEHLIPYVNSVPAGISPCRKGIRAVSAPSFCQCIVKRYLVTVRIGPKVNRDGWIWHWIADRLVDRLYLIAWLWDSIKVITRLPFTHKIVIFLTRFFISGWTQRPRALDRRTVILLCSFPFYKLDQKLQMSGGI